MEQNQSITKKSESSLENPILKFILKIGHRCLTIYGLNTVIGCDNTQRQNGPFDKTNKVGHFGTGEYIKTRYLFL